MAAPTPTARVTPSGIMLRRGWKTLITFALDTDISIWEKSVQGAGQTIGDKIDITTMWNNDYKTSAPPALIEGTECKVTFAYDPACKSQIEAILGVPTTITERSPDGSTYCYYGYLQDVEWGENQIDEFPEGTMTVVQTNSDHVNNVEAGPVLTSVAGT